MYSSSSAQRSLQRRYKALYEVVQKFVLFGGPDAAELDPQVSQAHLVEDKSLSPDCCWRMR